MAAYGTENGTAATGTGMAWEAEKEEAVATKAMPMAWCVEAWRAERRAWHVCTEVVVEEG